MRISALLIRLYPPAIRRRWGAEIAHEADAAGPRSWFDTAVEAVKLWLHPSDWPETAVGQTSRVVVTAVVAVITTAVLLVRAAGPTALAVTADRPATCAWLVPIVAGSALAAPLPPLRWGAFKRLIAAAAGTLATPVLAFAVLVLAARSGLVDHPAYALHIVLLVCYWATLGFAGMRLCKFTGRIDQVAIMPSTRRLYLALLFLGGGLALGATQALFAFRATLEVVTAVPAFGLAALAAAVLVAGLDLRRIPGQPGRTSPSS